MKKAIWVVSILFVITIGLLIVLIVVVANKIPSSQPVPAPSLAPAASPVVSTSICWDAGPSFMTFVEGLVLGGGVVGMLAWLIWILAMRNISS